MKELPEDLQAKIIAYIDGDLPADEAAALEVYLANTDPGLSEMVVGMMADRHSLSVLPKINAPHDLAGRVMDQLERSSLLHNVEHDLGHARQPWWHSRVAVAAGVALVIGGFSYFVIHTVYRGSGLLNQAANTTAVVPGTPRVAEKRDISSEVASVDIGRRTGDLEHGKASKDVVEAEQLASALPSHEALQAASDREGMKTKAGAPMSLVMDTRESTEDKLQRDKEMANKGLAVAKANGYIEAPSAQVALNKVHAAPAAAVDGPPVVVYCVARDTQDLARLEARLASFMDNTDDAQVNLVRTNQITVDLAKSNVGNFAPANGPAVGGGGTQTVNSGSTLTLSGNNTLNDNTSKAAVLPSITNSTQTVTNVTGGNGSNLDATATQAQIVNRTTDNNALTLENGQFVTNQNAEKGYRVLSAPSYRQRNAKVNEQQHVAEKVAEYDTFAGQLGQPYRVYLRPEQLDQLTTEFRVLTINRGQASYVIPREKGENRRDFAYERDVATRPATKLGVAKGGPAGEEATPGVTAPAGPRARSEAAAKPAAVQPAPGETFAGKTQQPGDAGRKAGRQEVESKAGQTEGVSDAMFSQAAPLAQKKRDDGRWIEVIIAMDPPATAAVAAPSTTPAKPASESHLNVQQRK